MTERKYSLLLIEDDENLGFVTQDALQSMGYDVDWAKNGAEGYEMFHAGKYDLLLIDVMMPKKDGFTLTKEIKGIDPDVNIFFLTARSQESDRIEGLKLGVDDYITKPFSVEELDLRIKNHLSRIDRAREQHLHKDIYQIGKYKFDYPNHELIINGEKKLLTKKEAALLRLLCIHQGRVLERDVALRIIWGSDDYFLGRSMDVFITKLRKYLSKDPAITITNIHGVGFRLDVDEKK